MIKYETSLTLMALLVSVSSTYILIEMNWSNKELIREMNKRIAVLENVEETSNIFNFATIDLSMPKYSNILKFESNNLITVPYKESN